MLAAEEVCLQVVIIVEHAVSSSGRERSFLCPA